MTSFVANSACLNSNISNRPDANHSSEPYHHNNYLNKEIDNWKSNDSLGLCNEVRRSINYINGDFKLVESANEHNEHDNG